MKKFNGIKVKYISIIFLIALSIFNLSSQTSGQARMFINRSHIAIAKVEKEMYKLGKNEYDAEIKKAIKYQVVAIKLHQQGNYKEAVGYSFRSRNQCIQLCSKMNIGEGVWYNLNDDEKTYCNPSDFDNLSLNAELLDPAEIKKIEELDILNVLEFRKLVLNIKNIN